MAKKQMLFTVLSILSTVSAMAAVDVTESTSSSAVTVPASRPANTSNSSALKESSRYEDSEKKFNVRYQVPGILVNSHTLEIDYAITPILTVGPIGNYTRNVDNSDVSLEYTRKYLGVAGHYFVTGEVNRNGFYVKPYVEVVEVRGRVQDLAKAGLTKKEQGVALGVAGVYQFVTSQGLNIHVGGGLESRNYADRSEYVRSNGEEQILLHRSNAFPLVGELTLGYAF